MRHLLAPLVVISSSFCAVALPVSEIAYAAKGETIGLGLNLGSEATYGNSLTFHWRAYDFGELNAGLGYNSSGAKLGIGHTFVIDVTRSIGVTIGQSLVYSGGRDSEVEIDAAFTPEGTNDEEPLTAVKTYELGPAILGGFSVGGFYKILKWLRLNAQLCYNQPLWGNEVELGKRITYDEDVEVTNESEFNEALDREAEREVRAGGLGFSVGAAVWF